MKRCLSIEEEIFLNQFVQNIHSLDEMNAWFKAYEISERRDVIENLLNMVIQSHPTMEELETSICAIGKLNSSTANILLSKDKPFSKFGYRVCHLPENELLIAFDVLLLILSKSDTRRKSLEKPHECNHWWHKDLSDQAYLNVIRKVFKK